MQLLLARCLEAAAEDDGESGRAAPAAPSPRPARRVHRARLPQRQARPGAGRGGRRPDRREHRGRGALGGALARRRVLARDRPCSPRRSSSCACWSRRRSTFPRRRSSSSSAPARAGRLADAKAQIAAVLATARQGALLNEGIRVVLAGQPNVGKSSLLNALAGAELAIVTDIPGTTRDKVGETIQIEGVPVHVTDTAGLREAGDAVEAIGVARSWSAIGDADAVRLPARPDADRRARLRRRRSAHRRAAWPRRSRRTGSSRSSTRPMPRRRRRSACTAPTRSSSRRVTGAGLDRLRARAARPRRLAGRGRRRLPRPRPPCRRAAAGRRHLDAAEAHAAAGDQALELVAEELRAAHDALGEITGRFTADDLLGAIFGRFCIGK